MTNTYTFPEIIANNYDEIIRNFRNGLKSKGYEYDEDLINDAYISCHTTLKDKLMTKQEALKYYWTAYINKYKDKMSKPYTTELCEDMNEYDDIAVTVYNQSVDKIYDKVIAGLQDKYGVRKAWVWEMYTCKGMTSKQIKEMGINDVSNYSYFTKQVKRYIKNHIIPEDKELKELSACRLD